ncbi:hypothetical protein [Pseudomonas citronellolis]|uniref:hypothetical protein n=1 Tax=Pseudomonas citronellolis TaxID=53408 RepID=UPI0012FE4113|nr:hypothetical protein [Pseudomonas citronellolis]
MSKDSALLLIAQDVVISLNGVDDELRRYLIEESYGYFKFVPKEQKENIDISVRVFEISDDWKTFLLEGFRPTARQGETLNVVEFNDSESVDVKVVCVSKKSRARVVDFYFPIENREVTRRMVFRLLRAIVVIVLREKGWGFVHASAVSLDGDVLAFIGDKFSGKTTSLLAMLEYTDARFITNDKMALSSNSPCDGVIGFPISIGIRVGTLEVLPSFDRRCSNLNKVYKSGDKALRLTTRELTKVFGKAPVSGGRLKAIFFPVYNESYDGYSIERLSFRETLEIWNRNTLSLLVDIEPDQSSIKEFFKNLDPVELKLPSVPCYRVISNKGSLRDAVADIYKISKD